MPQYVLLLHEAANAPVADMTPADFQAVIKKYNDWAGRLAKEGRLAGGNKLGASAGCRILVKDAARKVLVKDGPYAETKEVLGGYFIVKAEDYDDAAKLASDCPHLDWHGGRIEIREVDAAPGRKRKPAEKPRARAVSRRRRP